MSRVSPTGFLDDPGIRWLLVFLSLVALGVAKPAPARSLLLDGALVGGRTVVAVGERGAIISSSDSGVSWTSLPSPTKETLTGLSFADDRVGWAVGHGGTVLATTDGGQTWTRQLLAESVDTSFLDVLALDARTAIAIGAFGTTRLTRDGGQTWAAPPPIDQEPHLNRIVQDLRGTLWIAGEAGTLLTSSDRGESWSPAEDVGYEGSLYGLLPLPKDGMLVHGLRGHLFLRAEREGAWQALQVEQPVMLATSCQLRTGAILIAGTARWFFISHDQGHSFSRLPLPITSAVAELLETPDGGLLALGEAGAIRLKIPASSPTR